MKNFMKNVHQYYIDKYKELYDNCLIESGMENSDDVTAGADSLFEKYATAEHIVGYYIYCYGEFALKVWEKNLSYYKKETKTKGTRIDKKVTRILRKLFCH